MTMFDILVVGAGPAGLAAAHAAAAQGAIVGVADDNPQAGGQIWRGGAQQDRRARRLWQDLQAARNVSFMHQARVLYPSGPGGLAVQTPSSALTLRYQRLVIATGARELLLPFPGWTLPGVTGAGGLQALAKGGYPVAGKRVVVAGSGPLLLAVAATLVERGAHVAAIVEQADNASLARFAAGLLATPSKLAQALLLQRRLRGIPYHRNSHVRFARGAGALQEVEVQGGSGSVTIACDYLACGYGLVPNPELALALGCATSAAHLPHGGGYALAVQADAWQQTSIPGVYCAGEGTGVGGGDKALVEGRIAGLAAAGRMDLAEQHFGERAKRQAFARRLARAFALNPAIRALAGDDTIVCRCEDVCHGELRQHDSWRSAKLHTRCGMGPCQGRVCGGATDILYGWRPESVRVPLSPARVDSIITNQENSMTAAKWQGIFPAVTTKFHADEELDHAEMEKHFEFQIQNGVHGMVTCGSLGEASTLSLEEKLEVAKLAVKVANGRVPVLANVSETRTANALRYVRQARDLGVQGFMVS